MEIIETPDALLGKTDEPYRFVVAKIPFVGGVRFRIWKAKDQAAYEELKERYPKYARVVPLIISIANKAGSLVHTEEHLPKLMGLDNQIVDHMLDVITKHCVAQQSVDEMIAEAEKNLDAGQ